MSKDVETLKRRMPLIEYLRQHNWKGSPVGRSEFVGLCPLHEETQPSFYVNTRKNVFYCHGCGQGGDLIRFVQLSRHLSFRQSLACLDQQTTAADFAAVLEQAAAFYRQQLNCSPEVTRYLNQRGVHDAVLIRELGIGYAPGGCPEVILVEGLFDYAVLRQVGFPNVTCSLGTHLNAGQFQQLCDGPRTVYLTFDVDQNQSGQQAAQQLAYRLAAHGIAARRVLLPEGHDPNSFIVQGGDAHGFRSLLEAAQP